MSVSEKLKKLIEQGADYYTLRINNDYDSCSIDDMLRSLKSELCTKFLNMQGETNTTHTHESLMALEYLQLRAMVEAHPHRMFKKK